MNANWRSTNTPNVVWINTDMHRCTQMEDDTAYPLELGQGRHATNPVPRVSMFCGKPIEQVTEEDVDNTTRAIFWRSYTATVALVILCVVILANWPTGGQ